jgi:hypothetical protein
MRTWEAGVCLLPAFTNEDCLTIRCHLNMNTHHHWLPRLPVLDIILFETQLNPIWVAGIFNLVLEPSSYVPFHPQVSIHGVLLLDHRVEERCNLKHLLMLG